MNQEQLLRVALYVFIGGMFAWVIWWMMYRRQSNADQPMLKFKLWHLIWPPMLFRHLEQISNARGRGRLNLRRERILFAIFIAIALLAVLFDPFSRANR